MQHPLLLEIKKLTSELKQDHPHLSRFLKDIPGPEIKAPQLTEEQLREHLRGLKVIRENYRKK